MISLRRFFLSAALLLLFSSCFARIDGTIGKAGSSDLRLRVSLGPKTAALLDSLRSFMGSEGGDAPVLDASLISRSLAAAPGIRSVALRNSRPEALDGTISLFNVGDFLTGNDAKSRFITFAEGPELSSIVVTLDRNSAPELISRLSPEAEGYLSALMAPAVTGETLTAREYLDLVASIYDQPLAEEITVAEIHGVIDFPRPVKAVAGGTFSGTRAVFNIPLLDILVLEKPLRYEIIW